MTADDRARAFDRFWSTAPGGSGLGLAIARELVEHDGGSIGLADARGGGLTAGLLLRGGGSDLQEAHPSPTGRPPLRPRAR